LIEGAGYYAQEGGAALGEQMFDAALKALEPIQRMPGLGSPRLGRSLLSGGVVLASACSFMARDASR
jgi:hypothetical protein